MQAQVSLGSKLSGHRHQVTSPNIHQSSSTLPPVLEAFCALDVGASFEPSLPWGCCVWTVVFPSSLTMALEWALQPPGESPHWWPQDTPWYIPLSASGDAACREWTAVGTGSCCTCMKWAQSTVAPPETGLPRNRLPCCMYDSYIYPQSRPLAPRSHGTLKAPQCLFYDPVVWAAFQPSQTSDKAADLRCDPLMGNSEADISCLGLQDNTLL